MKLIELVAIAGISVVAYAQNSFAADAAFSRLNVTNNYSVEYSNDLPAKTVDAIKGVMQVVFSQSSNGELTKLKSFVSDTQGQYSSTRYATYDERQCSVIISMNSSQDEKASWETIAHEVGHSMIFSKMTPGELTQLARRVGGWSISGSPNTFYDHSFFVRFFGEDVHASSFPSLYSYTNVHEWLAENFATYVLSKVHKRKSANASLNSFFDGLFK